MIKYWLGTCLKVAQNEKYVKEYREIKTSDVKALFCYMEQEIT